MNVDKLIKMANEIAAFFEGEPDRNAAIDGFVDHLCRFWDPRMRRELLAGVDAAATSGGDTGLSALALEAIAARRGRLAPAA
jgi:formate dehydrogenase subunit delta